MKRLIVLAATAVLAACASGSNNNWAWDKPGASQQSFQMDTGQCRAQAFSVASGNMMQIAIVYDGCMQGKGWSKVATSTQGSSYSAPLPALPSPPAPQTKGCELAKNMELVCP